MQVLDFWSNEVTAYTNLKAKAIAAVASAEAELATARLKQADAVAAAAKAQKDIAALRAKIATDGPADAADDALTLRKDVAASRNAAGRVLLYGSFAIEAQIALDRAHTELDRAAQKLAAASAAKDQAAKQHATFTAWKNELAASPLATVQSDANDKLNGLNGSTERAAAKKKLDDNFPSAGCIVQSALSARRTVFNKLQQHLADAADSTRTALVNCLAAASAGPDNGIRGAQITFDLGWNNLARYVRTAKEDLDRAVMLYASVAAMPALPPAITLDILTASAYGTKASAALTDEQDRNAALITASDDRYTLDTHRINAESKDPTSSAVDPTVAADLLQVNKSTSTLVSKDTAFVATPGGKKADLDAWIAALPDDAIRAVLAMQEADEILTRLSGITASDLVTVVTNADQGLGNALFAAAQADRTVAYLEDALAQRLAWLARAEQGRLDNLFSAVRGDR
jgi:hypothetical protein